MKHYRSFALLISLLALGISTAFYAGKTVSDKPLAGSELLINMTSDATEDAHSALMGLHFAEMALANGLDVTVFLNVDGVKLLLPESRTLTFDNENLNDLLMEIANNGGSIVACPHCMQINKVTEDMLPEGVTVSNPKLMSGKLKKAPTVFTY